MVTTQPDPGGKIGPRWFERLPGWGAGEQVGMAPGQQGPDYSRPRAPQPGEAPELLPQHPGTQSERAADNERAIRKGREWAGDRRLPDYLDLNGPINFRQALTLNFVDLGGPPKGQRWLIRQLAIVSGSKVDDTNFTGVRANFFIGRPPPSSAGPYPQMTDWAWNLTSLAVSDFTVTKDFGSNPALQVLDTQRLYVLLTNDGTDGYLYLAKARVEQVAERAVLPVREV